MSDLSLGGSFCFVGQKNANQSLREIVGSGVSDKEFQADMKTLDLFDQLPSLDPFLLREGLRLNGMRERVTVLRGQMTAGPQDGRWLVSVRIPLGTVRG